MSTAPRAEAVTVLKASAACALLACACKERGKESKEYRGLELHLNILGVLAKL